jgi:hypothetical protein
MKRRVVFTVAFIVFVAVIVWYASSMVRIPELSFNDAAKIDDHKVRVMVATKVLKDRDITPAEGTVTFYAVDRQGTESKVLVEEADPLVASQLSKAAQSGAEVSVAGHMCGDQFKATNVFLPAY